jgi:TRAP-type C4-dicarboxylate transport system permease small subunit
MKGLTKIVDGAVRFIEGVSRVGGTISGIGIFVLVILVVNDVVMRYAFNRPTSWGLEISEYLMLYFAFIGFAYTLLVDRHVRVDLLLGNLPQRVQTGLRVFESLAGLFFCVLLTWKTAEATYSAYTQHWVSFTHLAITIWPVYIIMPIGSALFGLQFACKIYHHGRALVRPS